MFTTRLSDSSFFPKSGSSSTASQPNRRLTALVFAVAMSCTTGFTTLAADPAPTNDPVLVSADLLAAPGDNDALLKKGADELNNRQYEEALATLQQVNTEGWKDAEKATLADMISRAQFGSDQRKAARAEFEKGEAALASSNPTEAIAHYRAAADNKYADDGTKAKAREQIAVADAAMKQSATDFKSVYFSAKQDYKSGNLAAAKAKFEELSAAGYKAPLFEKSPSDWLKTIDKDMTAAAAAQPATPDSAAAAAAQPATPDAAAAQPVAEIKVDARAAYRQAVKDYRSGDWIAARRNFVAARDAGFKPGLFEDSPSKYLARMDSKEQADAARHAAEVAKRDAEMAAAAKASADAEAARAADEAAAAKAAEEAAAKAAAEATAASAAAAQPVAPTDQPVAQPTQPADSGAAAAAAQPTAPADQPAVQPATPSDELRKAADADRIMAEQNKAEAIKLCEMAAAAAAANNYAEALDLYNKALEKDPTNADAQSGKGRMVELTSRSPADTGSMKRQSDKIEQERQYIQYSFETAVNDANRLIGEGKFADAQKAIDKAGVARNSNPQIFQPSEINSMDATIAAAQTRLNATRTDVQSAEQRAASEAAAQEARQKEIERQKQIQQTVASLIKRSRQLTDQGNYKQALGVVDQILLLDPRNDYAVGVRPLLVDRVQFQDQRNAREKFDVEFTNQLNRAEEMRIPYNDVLIYPENWPDLSETRERSVAAERGEQEEDTLVQAQLDRRLPEVKFDSVPFTDVVDFLRDITAANIFVNWRALEGAGIDKSSPVTARLRDVKFSKALMTILDDVGGGTVKLGYTIDEGVITISTDEDLAKNVVTRVYDIRDLIINVPDFTDAPDFNISSNNTGTSGRGGGGGGGGGGGNLFGGQGGGGGGPGGGDDAGPTRQELVDSIIRLIQDTVATDSWKDNGGTVGSLRELSGQLIVTQTPENQRELVRLLEQLRETRAIQVTVEARFLTVSRNFLEDIAVDFDFSFSNVDDRINGGGPIRFVQNSAQFTQPSNMDTTIPGSLATLLPGSSLTTAMTFIDDFSFALLVRATQAEQSQSVVTAPRITLFNGQRAYVLVAVTRAYVSDLEPIVGSNAVGFDPVISTVQSGVLLDVSATVSSDRKYVTLTLRPQLSKLLQLVPFPIGGSTVFPGGGDGSTQAFANTGIIQQPETEITQVRTTVSVPDGGTLLLGGQTLSGELEREQGVPILSKIPFLKRLFTNRATSHDDRVLLILVKPTIIIQREQEQRQFPLLSQKGGG